MPFTCTTQIRITLRNYHEFLHYVCFFVPNHTLPIIVYMDIHIRIAPPHFIMMGSHRRLRNYFDYKFIDGKISHHCQENLMTRWRSIFKLPNIWGRNQRLAKKLDEWLSFRSSHYKKKYELEVQKYNSSLKLNSSTTRRL